MQCKYCGSEWQARGAYSQVRICPFCGKQLKENISDDASFDDVLKSIFDQFGYELLMDKHKFISVLSDLAPKMKSERKILTVALDQGIAHFFINVSVSKRESNVRQTVRELQVIMSGKAIYIVISSLIRALNWDDNLIDLLPMESTLANDDELNKNEHKVIDIKSTHSAQSTFESISSHAHMPVKTGSNADRSKPLSKNEEKIEIKEITFFSNDGNMQHPTVEGDAFLQGHVQYIGIKVWINTLLNDIDLELHWTIYRQDGSAYSKENITPLHLHKGDEYAYHSWGWATAGKWNVGKYKVMAYFKDKTSPCTAYFTVYAGYYSIVKKVNGVRLFAGGDEAPAQNSREYTNIFYSSSLRRVYFEFLPSKIRKSTYTCMLIKIHDINNNILTNFLTPIQLIKGDDSCWVGWGWSEPGNWKKGRYTYEASLYGSNAITGNFDIL